MSVEPDSGLIVEAALTAGNAPDGPTGVALLERERDPVEVLADSAYGSGETRTTLNDAGHTQTIKPLPIRPMTDAADAFTIDDFDIDLTARTASCPGGHTVPISERGYASFRWRCHDCPVRTRCTNARAGRQLSINPRHDQLARARTDAADPHWQARYRRHRPMVERSIAWLVARGHRRVRYRGIAANSIWLAHRAAAVNLKRLLTLGLDHQHGAWTLPAPA